MKKRIFAQIIAVLTAMSLLSANAFAASFTELQDVIDTGNPLVNKETNETRIDYDAGNVTLYEDVERGENDKISSITISGHKNITLDLNGNDIDAKKNAAEVIKVMDGSNLTLMDESKGEETGKITGGTTGVSVWSDSSFAMKGGAIPDNDGDGIGGGVINRGKFVMNGGAISDNDVTGEGGGDANWTGYLFRYDEETGELAYDEDGNPVWTPVTLNDAGRVVYAGRLLGVTAKPDADTIQAAEEAAKAAAGGYVEISGNYSANHGGGIANNGTLTIGAGPLVDNKDARPEFSANKELVSNAPEAGNDRQLKDGEFTFVLKDEAGNEFTGTSDADGNVTFDFPKNYFAEAGTYTFTVTEKNGEDNSITYNETEYTVEVTVKEETQEITVGTQVVKITVLSVEKTAITNAETSEELTGEMTFVNKYTPRSPNLSLNPALSPRLLQQLPDFCNASSRSASESASCYREPRH